MRERRNRREVGVCGDGVDDGCGCVRACACVESTGRDDAPVSTHPSIPLAVGSCIALPPPPSPRTCSPDEGMSVSCRFRSASVQGLFIASATPSPPPQPNGLRATLGEPVQREKHQHVQRQRIEEQEIAGQLVGQHEATALQRHPLRHTQLLDPRVDFLYPQTQTQTQTQTCARVSKASNDLFPLHQTQRSARTCFLNFLKGSICCSYRGS